ncbi:unnamed protein product [Polarella glacialis]|uniref:Uncharacterized protein n=1 Tax=Polarella glacialis TaxID=89957 RepID=A0A813DL54_POLGL|nr:unnamed protein product [Polarella glacialis]
MAAPGAIAKRQRPLLAQGLHKPPCIAALRSHTEDEAAPKQLGAPPGAAARPEAPRSVPLPLQQLPGPCPQNAAPCNCWRSSETGLASTWTATRRSASQHHCTVTGSPPSPARRPPVRSPTQEAQLWRTRTSGGLAAGRRRPHFGAADPRVPRRALPPLAPGHLQPLQRHTALLSELQQGLGAIPLCGQDRGTPSPPPDEVLASGPLSQAQGARQLKAPWPLLAPLHIDAAALEICSAIADCKLASWFRPVTALGSESARGRTVVTSL